MAGKAHITGYGARDKTNGPVTGRQVLGQGNVPARGVGFKSGDAQGDAASTHVMPAEKSVAQAAGAAHDTYQAAVYLSHILVTTLGTAELVIYDNDGPSGDNSGTIVGIVPANAARGTIVDCRAPLMQGGFSAISALNTPAVTFFYA
jgi:hypothetical protein